MIFLIFDEGKSRNIKRTAIDIVLFLYVFFKNKLHYTLEPIFGILTLVIIIIFDLIKTTRKYQQTLHCKTTKFAMASFKFSFSSLFLNNSRFLIELISYGKISHTQLNFSINLFQNLMYSHLLV